jgi:hypothetical protein
MNFAQLNTLLMFSLIKSLDMVTSICLSSLPSDVCNLGRIKDSKFTFKFTIIDKLTMSVSKSSRFYLMILKGDGQIFISSFWFIHLLFCKCPQNEYTIQSQKQNISTYKE